MGAPRRKPQALLWERYCYTIIIIIKITVITTIIVTCIINTTIIMCISISGNLNRNIRTLVGIFLEKNYIGFPFYSVSVCSGLRF